MDENRTASREQIEEYTKLLSQQQVPKSNLGALDMTKLPGTEALLVPGNKDGQNIIVKNGNTPEVYQWSSSELQWIKIGEAIDAANSGKQTFQGKEYDYVFDVDLGDGLPKKLPYNNSENPYHAAQKFIWREQLSQEFLDQIAQFIMKNSQPVTLTQDQQSQSSYADPFTGGNRYIPSASSSSSSQSSSVSKQQQQSFSTGKKAKVNLPGAYTTSEFQEQPMSVDAQVTVQKTKHFPLSERQFSYFDSGNFTQISAKIIQLFQGNLLSENECHFITTIADILSQSNRYHATKFDVDALDIYFGKLYTKLPEDKAFPVIDLTRLFVLHPDGASKLAKYFANVVLSATIEKYLKSSTPAANQMMALRFFSNCFRWSDTRDLLSGYTERILETLVDLSKSDNRNVRMAVATLILNTWFLEKKNFDAKVQCLSLLAEMAPIEKDNEVSYRIIVALGNCLYNDKECVTIVKDLELGEALKSFVGSQDEKLKESVSDLLVLIK